MKRSDFYINKNLIISQGNRAYIEKILEKDFSTTNYSP